MTPLQVVAALLTIGGAVTAVTARGARVAIAGLTLAFVAVPAVADPALDALPVAARIVAAVLAGYLVWIASRTAPLTGGTHLGPIVLALAAAAAFFAGAGIAVPGVPGPAVAGLALSRGVALALGALVVEPAIGGRDPFRTGVGLALAVVAADLLHAGVAGPPSAVEALVSAGLTVALGALIALLVSRSGMGLVADADAP